jgi:ABC-2 type transport system ATP-binding protein
MTLAIEAEDLRKTYPPAVTALDGVSVAVEAGTIFGLLGPNGAGKSTTVRVLSTLTRPDSGRAQVGGIDVLADPVGVRRAIGMVGQKHGADPEATGRENLVLQGEFYGLTGRELKQRVARSLERFGLTDAAGRQVRTYSGGMQRRLEIAMGLLHRPQVLFLDEPTTGLDPEARVQMWREIERLAAEEQMTILLTTHSRRPIASPRCSRSSIAARSWRGERPTSSRASFTATRSRSSSPTPATPGRALRWAASPASARSRSTAA